MRNACPYCGDIETNESNRDGYTITQCKSCSYILDKKPALAEQSDTTEINNS